MKSYELVRAARSYADAIDKDRGVETGLTDLLRDAADEIERLGEIVAKYEQKELLIAEGVLRAQRAVPGGKACHSPEQHMPETTTKGEHGA